MIAGMSNKRRATQGGGRPSKGDRRMFAVRMPLHDADAVMKLAEKYDLSYNDMILELITAALRSGQPIGHSRPHQQELSA